MPSHKNFQRQRLAKTIAALLLGVGIVAGDIPTAHATNYYWDIDGATPGAGGAIASGTWSSVDTNWSTNPLGTVATSPVTTSLTDDLFFSAGMNATGNTVITVNTAENAKSLNLQEGTLFIGGTGSITLGGTGIINVPNSSTASPLSATIGNTNPLTIAGSNGLTKNGIGTLVLNGSAVNTFTGGLNVNGGTLDLRFANLATPTDLINSSNAVNFGTGGGINITGNAAGITSQTFGSVTVNSGGGRLLANPNGGTDTNITLGTLTATATGSSFLVGRALSSGTGNLAITTTSNVDGSGTYGGRVVFADGTANTGYDWAANTGGAGPSYTLSAYTGYTALDLTAGTDTAHSRINASATMTGSRETNSLKFENPLTAQILDI